MKINAAILILLISTAPGNGTPIRIMPLGDSITRGFPTNPENGYRKTLYDLLQADGYSVDFVGSQSHGVLGDTDHEGHNGWFADHTTKTNTILSHVAGWLAATPADIVLLHIGTNDILSETPDAAEVSAILDEIFTAGSNSTVVLAQIINARIDQDERADISTYNSNLNTMAQTRIGNGDDLILVDMENGAGLDYANPSLDIGTFHPTQLGYDKMATNWFPAVRQAITNQLAKTWSRPLIHAVTVSGSSIDLSMTNLTAGIPMSVQQTVELAPPAWSNIGSFVPAHTQTNWNAPTDSGQAFFRVVIP